MNGVDYSSSRPSPAALVKAGVKFVLRYLEYSHATDLAYKKFLTKAEAEALLAAGLAIGFNLESTAGRATVAGRAGGEADATDARVAIESCGLPLRPVFFSVDVNVTPAQFPAIADYFAGAVSVLGVENVGAYGESDLLDYLLSKKLISRTWRTAATAWSPAGTHTYDIVQGPNGQVLAGGQVDFDTSSNYQSWAVMPPEEEMPVFTAGGYRTATVPANTPYYTNPGDASPRGHIATEGTYGLAVTDSTGQWVALDGNWSKPGSKLTQAGWVRLSSLTNVVAFAPSDAAPLLAKIAAVKAALA